MTLVLHKGKVGSRSTRAQLTGRADMESPAVQPGPWMGNVDQMLLSGHV